MILNMNNNCIKSNSFSNCMIGIHIWVNLVGLRSYSFYIVTQYFPLVSMAISKFSSFFLSFTSKNWKTSSIFLFERSRYFLWRDLFISDGINAQIKDLFVFLAFDIWLIRKISDFIIKTLIKQNNKHDKHQWTLKL